MLAIHRPRMGSTQPSDPNLPFGYAVDPSQDFFLDPPEPAPGAPLLSDNETKLLSSFFEDMTADHYNLPSFGEGLNFSDAWLELPPQFMGTATSFGQSPAPPPLASPGHSMPHNDFADMMSMGSNLMPPPPPPPQQQQQQHQQQPPPPPQQHHHQQSHPTLDQHASADVLQAASTLLHNGSSSRTNTNGSGPMFSSTRDVPHSLGPPVGHLRHQPMEDFKRAERGSVAQASLVDDHDSTFADMFFGPAPGERVSSQRANQVPNIDVQWGSDARFNRSNSFVPDPKETYDALSRGQLRYMECLEPSQSTDNTRPPSPNGEHAIGKGHSRKSSEVLKKEEDADAPPRKRRKSRSTKEEVDEDDEENGTAMKAARKRKTKTEPTSATPPAENGTGRRRKSGTGAKPARENLTDAQKRENHIKSEQKRRTLIKEGFDDLCELVPGLKGGGFSKSTMLTMAAEWLEEIMKGNDELRAQESALVGR
ncbi:BHLH family transcription factor [Colletotrichum scovillei]|uniref:BHLH family transcription factor n=1 Tax=Colletotrichum scovillei TaxID=1209932 RepID=A0A9P7RAT5_9PEZI|nr:BHLH family transcription factor [Colletotrichum scovillei]KAF4776037.1 BHLH family transcription factor [Colletotrichum scovillei]KAG7054090.1 BHLH family transcription factor [Colletotrichum scovillei]KAG7072387.1 BHLH family transcription factor [Colletotrichum scovillei]KAG7080609.1 BHLH family transcription factor [Colletotrichum scovillei]